MKLYKDVKFKKSKRSSQAATGTKRRNKPEMKNLGRRFSGRDTKFFFFFRNSNQYQKIAKQTTAKLNQKFEHHLTARHSLIEGRCKLGILKVDPKAVEKLNRARKKC